MYDPTNDKFLSLLQKTLFQNEINSIWYSMIKHEYFQSSQLQMLVCSILCIQYAEVQHKMYKIVKSCQTMNALVLWNAENPLLPAPDGV